MGVPIQSWGRWSAVAVLTFFNTFFTEFVFDCIIPWITNTIIDHKGEYIPYSKTTVLVIADMLVTTATTHHFLKGKVYDEKKFNDMYPSAAVLATFFSENKSESECELESRTSVDKLLEN
eukprot:3853417-Rhodomonas_salina.1